MYSRGKLYFFSFSFPALCGVARAAGVRLVALPVLDALAGFPGALAVGGACSGPSVFCPFPAYMGEAYI